MRFKSGDVIINTTHPRNNYLYTLVCKVDGIYKLKGFLEDSDNNHSGAHAYSEESIEELTLYTDAFREDL